MILNSKKFYLTLTSLLFIFAIFMATRMVYAISAEELNLKNAIDVKSKTLDEINKQIQETQDNLIETQQKGNSLKQEVKKSDYLINQINLNIKSSEIKVEKLGLEIESLNLNIKNSEERVYLKKIAIEDLLRKLQSKTYESGLYFFLKNKSLSESFFESQSIENLSKKLSIEINDLEALKKDLSEQKDEAVYKKFGVENEKINLKSKKNIAEDEKKNRQEILNSTKNLEKKYQDQIKKLELQQEEIAKEIESIEGELRSKIDINLLPVPRPGVLKWPVDGGFMSQGYGATPFAIKTYKGRHHNGIDIAAPIGTSVFAAEDGEVVFTANQDNFCKKGAYGKVVVIKHNNGLTTLYGHLSNFIVFRDQKVKRGDIIGYVGKTGWATGPHLHFTVWESVTQHLQQTRTCGLMPVGGDLDPTKYVSKPY